MQENTLHILIIDDDEINNFIAVKLINKIALPTMVSACLNGREGLDLIKSRIENKEPLPDVIFLDINMPIMNGWEFLEEFILMKDQLDKDIAINMLSSSVYNDDISKAKSYPVVKSFISKPLSLDKIKDILEGFEKS